MYGDKAIELIKELERCRDFIPAYNDELIRDIIEEVKFLVSENFVDVQKAREKNDDGAGLAEILPTVEFRHFSMERNRRCLMAYLYNRILRVKDVRWEMGSFIPPFIRNNLNQAEIDWFQKYGQILTNYMQSIGRIDLTQATIPPKSLYIEVRCLTDYGEFETEEGTTVLLKKNSQHSLLRSECEYLIRQGILQQVAPD